MSSILFIHPDLGIGGAERAVLDTGLALKSLGFDVSYLTTHHDKSHCFPETIDGRLSVTVVGDWLPRSVYGCCFALCAYLRMIYAALYLVFFSNFKYDVLYVDQISACIPIFRLFTNAKVVFYCHFPDLLLSHPDTLAKKLYRLPLNWIEEMSTGMAHRILVNSEFTKNTFYQTFLSLKDMSVEILYPVPDFSKYSDMDEPPSQSNRSRVVFLSINRYERKKNLQLAIESLEVVLKQVGYNDNVQLIVAGGYDERVAENREYYLELRKLTYDKKLDKHVTFLRSISDLKKRDLFLTSTCLLYTPTNEHFGIVPLESMYCKLPVIATNTGGPLETVINDRTGFLTNPTVSDFSEAMLRFIDINDEKTVKPSKLKTQLGQTGHDWVCEKFSTDSFVTKLKLILDDLVKL